MEEEIDNEINDVELIIDDGEEQDKYLKYDFLDTITDTVTWSSDWTLETIFNQMTRTNIELSPGFQRRDAWNIEKKSRFIESLYLGLPIPQLVLAEDKNNRGRYIVVDGKQRLTTIFQYINNKFKPKDTILSFANNLLYSEVQINNQQQSEYFLNQTVRSVILKNWKSESLLYSIFYRLNSGSLPLSPQELRAALKPGPVMEAIASYAESSPGIKLIFKKAKPDPRMKDVELLLRYISFTLFADSYDGDFKGFLDKTCDYFNKDWDSRKNQLFDSFKRFEESVEQCQIIFNSNSFKRFTIDTWETRFSRAVFDVQTYFINNDTLKDINIDMRGRIVSKFQYLCKSDSDFYRSITSNTNNMQNTTTRFVVFGRAIEELTGRKNLIPQGIETIYEANYVRR